MLRSGLTPREGEDGTIGPQQLSLVVRRIEAGVLSGSILLLALLTIGNVFSRSLLGDSLAWAEEISRFLVVLVTFVGLSYAAGRGRHIRMTALFDLLPDRPRKALAIFIAASTSALLFLLAYYALQYVGTVRTLGTVSPALRVPLWWVWLSAPLGFTLGGIQYALTAWQNVREPGIWLSFDRPESAPPPPEIIEAPASERVGA